MDTSQKLIRAITECDLDGVAGLLDADPQLLNSRTPAGVPAVLYARYYNQPAIVNLFLGRGAEVDIFTAAALDIPDRLSALLAGQPELANAVAPDGFSPLGLAAFFGGRAAGQLLVSQGAAVNAPSQNPQRVTPLHSAVASQALEIARLLLEHGADANARQEGGFTPLHAAAQNGQLEMVQLLLDHGADNAARNAEGHTALHFARQGRHTAVIRRLAATGAPE